MWRVCACDRPLLNTSRPAGAWPVHLGHMGHRPAGGLAAPGPSHILHTSTPFEDSCKPVAEPQGARRGALWSVWKQVPRAEPRKFYLPQQPLSAWGSSLESRKGTDAGWEPPALTQTRLHRSCTHAQGSNQGSQVLGAVGRLHIDGQAPSQVPPQATPMAQTLRGVGNHPAGRWEVSS